MTVSGVDFARRVTPLAGSDTPTASSSYPFRSVPRETNRVGNARELLVSNLAVIERAVRFVSRRHGLTKDEEDEFGSVVRLRLVENDYAILNKFEGRSSFAAYISVVIQRLLLDYRVHMWGKWHPSAEARRLGDVAVELEKLVRRDGRSVDEAVAILRKDGSVSTEQLREMAARLPERAPRPRQVELEAAEAVAVQPPDTFSADQSQMSTRLSTVVRSFLDGLEPNDRLAMQLRFDGGMSVADIARSLRLNQKKLYRQMDAHLRRLRAALESEGIAAADAAELVGDRGVVLDFRLDEVQT